jgi:acyl carrier protein
MDAVRDEWLAGVIAAVVEVLDEDGVPATDVTAATRLDADLALDSIEVAALGDLLRERYDVDLAGFLATLDLDRLIMLTVGDVALLVAGQPVTPHEATGSSAR